MANSIKTNSLAELVALRFSEVAGYLKVGAKAYFKGQLEGKRNGQTYRFVITDTGVPQNKLAVSSTATDMEVHEREVSMSLDPWNICINTNAIESVTDLNWDKEIAIPNSQKLVNAVVRKAVQGNLGKCGVAFVGEGFAPLSKASAYLGDITNEKIYGFISSQIEAILTTNGQQFVPNGAPEMYKSGLLGTFHGAEYRSQRFFKQVKVSADCVTGLTGATLDASAGYTDNSNGTATLKLSFSAAAAGFTIPKGMPIWVDGVFATDLVGDVTECLHAFVVTADVSVASSATTASVVVRAVHLNSATGSREVATEVNADLAATDFNSKPIAIPAAGNYFGGELRADGAMEFETLERLDAEGAEYEKGSVDGVNIHKNKLVDLGTMVNKTRFDIVSMAGIVEPRAVAYILVK